MKYNKHKIMLLLWIVVVSYLSLSPPSDMPEVEFNIPHLDKFVHWGMYFGVSFLLAPLWRLKKYWAIKVVIAGIIVGALMEILQYLLPYERSADVLDMLANSTGAICGLFAYIKLRTTKIYNIIFN